LTGSHALAAQGVGLTYTGGIEALRGVDMVVAEGAFVSIVGPSGCGKSTLLKAVAGLVPITSGTLAVGSGAAGIGCLIGFAFSQWAVVRNGCYPYAIFLQTVPIVAIAPLIIIWFGTGLQSVILVSFIVSLFPNGARGIGHQGPGRAS
jgi:energy-coupling factor transporter ATP-binding protein EcfA2